MIDVAVLGATGVVGQRLLKLLEDHCHFSIKEIAASKKNIGKSLVEARQFKGEILTEKVLSMSLKDPEELSAPYILSALSSEAASHLEPLYLSRGQHILTNASFMRMDPLVPLLLPEINPLDIELIEKQKTEGKIVANPNCVVALLAPVIHTLSQCYQVASLTAVSLQSVSGAGYQGVSPLDILGNVIPDIFGESEKICREIRKILRFKSPITVETFRVPVKLGHTISLHVEFRQDVELNQIYNAFRVSPYLLSYEAQRPQPLVDLKDNDTNIYIGSIKQQDKKRLSLVVMGDNLMRGASQATLNNLEALYQFLETRRLNLCLT